MSVSDGESGEDAKDDKVGSGKYTAAVSDGGTIIESESESEAL